jgi:hypothetical protein
MWGISKIVMRLLMKRIKKWDREEQFASRFQYPTYLRNGLEGIPYMLQDLGAQNSVQGSV